MILTQPEFKKTYYLSKTENVVKYDIIDAYIKDIKRLENTRDYLLTIYIKDADFLHDFDKDIINILVKNNNTWFKNDLEEDEIQHLYKPSVCSQTHTINVILSDVTKIYLNNKIQDINELNLNAAFFRKCLINLTIQHFGLYIHSKVTYNKWKVMSLNMYNEDEYGDDINESKEEIEESWKLMIAECNEILNNKIKLIQNTQKNIETLYAEVVSEKNKGRAWEGKITQLKTLIQNIIF